MTGVVFPMVLVAVITSLTSLGSPVLPGGRLWYSHGIYLLTRLVPVAAWGLWLLILGAVVAGQTIPKMLDASYFLSIEEASGLFALGLLMILPAANFLAAICLVFLSLHFARYSPDDISTAMIVLTSIATILTVLGDQLPWRKRQHPRRNPAAKGREILTIIFGIGSTAAAALTALQVARFSGWLNLLAGQNLPTLIVLMGTLAIGAAWMLIALDIGRRILMPIAIIPTLIILSFLVQLSWPYLCIVYLMMLILSFSPEKALTDERLVIATPV